MYNASLEYGDKIQELDRVFKIEIRVEHSTGTLILEDKDIAQGSFELHEASQVGDEFTVGGVFASNIEFKLVNKDKYDNIKFDGAKVYPTVSLLLKEGSDAHFLQATQPSKIIGFEEVWEHIPLGVFNIDIADRLRSTINIKAIDNMIFLDKPYSLSKLSYPSNLLQIYSNICTLGGVQANNFTITNGNFMVTEKPSGDLTIRNVLSFVAELSGSFARFNRLGELELLWYTESGITITPTHRSRLKVSDEIINITGVALESDNKDSNDNNIIQVVGTDVYSIDLTGNPLIKEIDVTVFSNILNKINKTIFTPYDASWHGNPAMQVGDIITHVDIDGVSHKTLITHHDYKYRGTSKIEAKAKSNIVRGFKSSDNRIASIIKKIEEDFDIKISDLDQAIINATELITNSLGGYVVKKENELLIMNTKDIKTATQVWRWNLNGLGYSSNGYGGPYELAMTMDGSINANFMTTGSLSAKIIKGGMLTSEDGSSHINMNTGEFNFKNILVYKDNVFNNIDAKYIKTEFLSSISAKMGKVTSGDIVGARLRTSETGARIDITGDTLDVYGSGNHKVMSIAKVTSSQQDDRIILNDILGNKAGSIGIVRDWLTLNSGSTHLDIDGNKREVSISGGTLNMYNSTIDSTGTINCRTINADNLRSTQRTIDMLLLDSLEG